MELQSNVKQSLMPPPVFTSVPSLPMFVVETTETRTRSRADHDQLNVQSTSDITSGGVESDTQGRIGRKHNQKRYPESTGDASSSREENYSRARKHRHHHHRHKSHRSVSDRDTAADVIVEGDPSHSEASEIPDQHPKPKPRRKLLEPEMEHQRSRSGSRTALLSELDRLTKENEELTRSLHQVSQSSQDSGYPHNNETQYNKEELENLRGQLSKLESNYRNLEKQRDVYKEELSNLKSIYETELDKISALQKQNEELNEDVSMLKNLVYRLNLELDRYQQKLQKQGSKSELPPLKVLPPTMQEKEATLLWNNINKNALKPLLEAYQETIKEKDDLIKNYEQDLNKFVANCKQVVTENEKLYRELEEANKQIEERSGGWEVLQQDARLAQEQTEVLTSQVQLQKDKLKEVQGMYEERVAELSKDNEMLVTKFHQYRGDLLTLKGQYSVLKEEYDKLRKDADNRVPFAVHTASVSECRRLFEELKAKYEGDKTNLASQMQELQSQKPQLEVQLENLTAENKQLQIHVKTLDKLLKKTQERCEQLQNRLVTCQVSRDASKRQLQKAMSFAEELVAEQENLLRQLHMKQEENNSIARLGTTIVYRMGSLKTKLKTVQKDAWAELDVVEKRIRRQETDVERMKDEYHREVLRLRNLVKQKEVIIGRLQREKTKTQEDLEVVWRAATSEDLRIKERLKQASLLPERGSDMFVKCSSALK